MVHAHYVVRQEIGHLLVGGIVGGIRHNNVFEKASHDIHIPPSIIAISLIASFKIPMRATAVFRRAGPGTAYADRVGVLRRIVYITNWELEAEFSQFIQWRRTAEKPTNHLFPNRCGERLTPAAFRKRLRLLCERMGITPHLTPHQFRHSAATLLIENGVDIRMVQRLLGHASIATTEIYTHVSDRALEATLEQADVLAQFVSSRIKMAHAPKLVPGEFIDATCSD